MMALYVASHYKNTPNDLILMSDAPAHQLFVLLGPVDETQVRSASSPQPYPRWLRVSVWACKRREGRPPLPRTASQAGETCIASFPVGG